MAERARAFDADQPGSKRGYFASIQSCPATAPPAQFAIAWCLKSPHVSTVMLGASKAEQLQENLQALTVLDKLDASVMQRMNDALDFG